MAVIVAVVVVFVRDQGHHGGPDVRARATAAGRDRPVLPNAGPATTVARRPVDPLSRIDKSGRTDVTIPLNAYFASVPNGTRINFPVNGRYRIEGTIVLIGKRGLLIDGHGSTFFATTNGAGAAGTKSNRTRSQWSLQAARSVTIRNMTVRGSSTQTGPDGVYDPNLEAQHGFSILGSSNIAVKRVTVGGTWGDLVYVGGIGSGAHTPSSGVTVSDSKLVGSSRQGVSVTNANHVTFSNNTIDSARRSLIDIEANSADDTIAFVTFSHNTFGRSRLYTIANGGAAAEVHDIVIDSNSMPPGRSGFKMYVYATGARRRYNYRVTNNRVAVTGQNDPMVQVFNVDNVTVARNSVMFTPYNWPERGGPFGSGQAPVMAVCASRVSVGSNRFSPKPTSMPDSVVRPCQ